MASPSRTVEREEERRHRTRTLVIASIASATAAVITSQLWIAGTWIAAAMTPVLVTLVSELLHRPTERLARRLTTPPDEVVPDAVESRPADAPSAPVRVYRAAPSTRRRRIAVGAVLGTAALAFVIAVAALTLPELVAGGSIGKGDRGTTFFGGKKRGDGADRDLAYLADRAGASAVGDGRATRGAGRGCSGALGVAVIGTVFVAVYTSRIEEIGDLSALQRARGRVDRGGSRR